MIMENGKMGVDHVETILDDINGPVAAREAVDGTFKAMLPSTELGVTKAPVNVLATAMKTPCTPQDGAKKANTEGINMLGFQKQNLEVVDHKKSLTLPSDTVTLTLEPVPGTNSSGPLVWRNYLNSKYYTSPYVPTMTYGDNLKDIKQARAMTFSAVQQFQDWHSKHVQKLAYTTAENAAASKLKAFATMKKVQHDLASPKALTNIASLPSPLTNSQINPLSEGGSTCRKRIYLTISNHYFQYLNRPKRARHEAFQVIFKAHSVSDTPTSPNCNKAPKPMFSWPSGKIPLPGYRPKRRSFGRIDGLAPTKKKRTIAVYRIPKPKLKPSLLTMRRFPHNSFRKPVWVQPALKKLAHDKRYFPLDKLKWDPLSKRFTVLPQQSSKKPASKGQWFSFPSAASKNKSIYNSSIRQKYPSGSSTASIFRANISTSHKDFPYPARVPQNIKEIKAILKCAITPEPEWFKSMDDYVQISILFRVRKAMAGQALRHSFIEGKHDRKLKSVGKFLGAQHTSNKTDSCSEKKEKIDTKETQSSVVLISSQTEFILSSWASRLPHGKHIENVIKTSKKSVKVSSEWLHTCTSGFVENPPRKKESHSQNFGTTKAEDLLLKQATHAWMHDTIYEMEDTMAPARGVGIARRIGDPAYNPDSVPPKVTAGNCCGKPSLRQYNGVVKSGNRGKGGHPKMQRSMSKVRVLNREKGVIQKDLTGRPKPSYCVRFRSCFCTFDCVCGAKTRGLEVQSLPCTKKIVRSNNSLEKSSSNASQNGDFSFDEFYDFSEISDVPDIVLKASPKSDAQCLKGRSKSTTTVKDDTPNNPVWKNGFRRRFNSMEEINKNELKLVRKIGDTEVYYKWAVRRSTESNSNHTKASEIVSRTGGVHTMVSPDFDCHEDLDLAVIETNIVQRNVPKQKISSDFVNGGSKFDDLKMESLDLETPVSAKIEADRLVKHMTSKWPATRSRSGLTRVLEKPSNLSVLTTKECLFTADKRLNSFLAKIEHSQRFFEANSNFSERGKGVHDVKCEKTCSGSSLFDYNSEEDEPELPRIILTNKPVGDGRQATRRRISSVIGGDDRNHGHVTHDELERSLANNVPAGSGPVNNDRENETVSGVEMGNRLPKLLGDFVPLNEFSRKAAVLSDLGKDIETVLQYASPEHACVMGMQNNVPSELVGDRKKDAQCAGFLTQTGVSDSLEITAERNDKVIYPPVLSGKDAKQDVADNSLDSQVKNAARSYALRSSVELKPRRRPGRKAKSDSTGTIECLDKPAKVLKRTLDDSSATKKQIPSGVAANVSSVETRSSRRLRSRVTNKRGRYEADYVADLPKSIKKPKKVIPTRNYDHDDFWQFYRDCEKTHYSMNLSLQHKYIKLLKSKEIDSPELNLYAGPHSQYSNVLCARSSIVRDAQVVPDDGLMPFMKRYTKPRKTIPELPKVADGHCAFCGRSFVGQEKKVYESHVARHGMRYTILAAPQLHKKKKKTKNTRKDAGLRKAKPGNSNTTVIVVDPPDKDAEKPSVKTEPSLSKTSGTNPTEQLRNFKPFPKPCNLFMGHRKQTARKSFSLASTLPKDMLIAALQCKMLAQSNINDCTRPVPSKPVVIKQPYTQSQSKKDHNSPLKITNDVSHTELSDHEFQTQSCFLPSPNNARKTLTGLPITYNHLHKT